MKGRVASMFIALSVGLAAGCWPGKKTANATWDTPSVPIGLRVHSSTKECRFGWLRFAAEYEYDTTLTKEVAWDFLKQCSIPIGNTKFVAEAILAPKIAAADASLQLSICVASKASKHLTVNHLHVSINTSDWGDCL